VVPPARPERPTETAPALEPVEDDGDAVTVFALAQFERLEDVE
jgi:hypothetical protein